jgi:hypothetical protein
MNRRGNNVAVANRSTDFTERAGDATLLRLGRQMNPEDSGETNYAVSMFLETQKQQAASGSLCARMTLNGAPCCSNSISWKE